MRGLTRREACAVAIAALLSRPALADDEKDDDAKGKSDRADKDDANDKGGRDDDDKTLAQEASGRFPQPVAVRALLRRKVLRPVESQPVLGSIESIVSGADGAISAVVAYGGILGFGTRRIAVPIDAMALLSPDVEIVDFEPDELDRLPTFDPKGTTALSPDAIIRVGLAKPSH